MRSRVLSLLSASFVAVSAMSLGAPASAAAGGYVAAPADGVLYSGCRAVAVPYSLSFDPGTSYWNLTVTAYGPDGIEAASDYVYSSDYPRTGTASLQFCGSDDAGRYTIRATGESSVSGDYSYRPYSLPDVSFVMRQPHSATTIAMSYKKGINRLTIAVSDERPNGYFPTRYAEIFLQVLRRGTWRAIPRSSEMTDASGRELYRFRHTRKKTWVRAVTEADGYDMSVSTPVRLR